VIATTLFTRFTSAVQSLKGVLNREAGHRVAYDVETPPPEFVGKVKPVRRHLQRGVGAGQMPRQPRTSGNT
jgi:hypothetical protein